MSEIKHLPSFSYGIILLSYSVRITDIGLVFYRLFILDTFVLPHTIWYLKRLVSALSNKFIILSLH